MSGETSEKLEQVLEGEDPENVAGTAVTEQMDSGETYIDGRVEADLANIVNDSSYIRELEPVVSIAEGHIELSFRVYPETQGNLPDDEVKFIKTELAEALDLPMGAGGDNFGPRDNPFRVITFRIDF